VSRTANARNGHQRVRWRPHCHVDARRTSRRSLRLPQHDRAVDVRAWRGHARALAGARLLPDPGVHVLRGLGRRAVPAGVERVVRRSRCTRATGARLRLVPSCDQPRIRGAVPRRPGISPTDHFSTSLSFVADALTSFAYGAIALAALPHGARTTAHEERAGEGYRAALADPRFVYFLFATMCLTWVDFQVTSTLPIHVRIRLSRCGTTSRTATTASRHSSRARGRVL
jgi:hypothetical protein